MLCPMHAARTVRSPLAWSESVLGEPPERPPVGGPGDHERRALRPDEIVDPGSFTDYLGPRPDELQTFLDHTPYDEPSFFGHVSVARRASERGDRRRAAETYRLNPLVFLVRAEMDQGLIGQQTYPSPTSRVEYAFGCGEERPGNTIRRLRGSTFSATASARRSARASMRWRQAGKTAGGWGPGIAEHHARRHPRHAPGRVDRGALPVQTARWPGLRRQLAVLEHLAGVRERARTTRRPSAGLGTGHRGHRRRLQRLRPIARRRVRSARTGETYPGGLCTLYVHRQLSERSSGDVLRRLSATGGYCLAVCNPNAPTPCRRGVFVRRRAPLHER